jgi:aspartate-semialdehyde dehydrogenase
MPPENPHLAIVGATGLVGNELLTLLEQRRFPLGRLSLLASERKEQRTVRWRDSNLVVDPLTKERLSAVDLAFFCANGEVSRQFAEAATAQGTTVIDNSSAFRMTQGVPLVVPEVNGHVLDELDGPVLIANPNCSTILALMVMTPLHRAASIQRAVICTYQAASGGGRRLLEALERQADTYRHGDAKPTPVRDDEPRCLFNVFSHESAVDRAGYNQEEMKLVRETHKIWDDSAPAITATCMRVGVARAHTESINLSFRKPLRESEARALLADAPGVTLVDDRDNNRFPEPLDATGRDDVLVGRIRADQSQAPDMGLELLVCGDQLRKGAALNAVQIAERLYASHPATSASAS